MAGLLRSLGQSMWPNSLIFNKLAKGNKSSFVPFRNLGHRCTRIDILSLTHIFFLFSDSDLNKSRGFGENWSDYLEV